MHGHSNPGAINISHCGDGRTAKYEVAELDFHMQRGEVPLLRPCGTKSNKGDIPGAGFSAVEKGSYRWVKDRLKGNAQALGQLFSEVSSHALHLTRHGVPKHIVGTTNLEPDAKFARGG